MRSDQLAHCLARTLFAADLVVVDRCTWPGAECDLLVLTKRLQVIDVEIKISRADLKADRDKAKWYDFGPWVWDDERKHGASSKTPRAWPRRVWKHYVAMPREMYDPVLMQFVHHASGVIVIDTNPVGHPENSRGWWAALQKSPRHWRHEVVKRAKPDPLYVPVTTADVIAIARLASLRMWDSYHDVEQHRRAKAEEDLASNGLAAGLMSRANATEELVGELMPRARSVEQWARDNAVKIIDGATLEQPKLSGPPAPLVLEPTPDRTGEAKRRKKIRGAKVRSPDRPTVTTQRSLSGVRGNTR